MKTIFRSIIAAVALAVANVALAQTVNYFPPPDWSWTYGGGVAAGSPTGGLKGAGTINAQGLFVNGTAVGFGSGTITGITFAVPSGLSISGSPCTTGSCSFTISTTLSGVLKGTGTGFTTATSSDILGLFSGTCNSSTVLNGSGACAAVALGSQVTGVTPAVNGGTGEAGTITGILKGNGTSAHTAAVASDVTGLFSGTCSSTTFLRGDGTCNTPAGVAGGSSGQVNYNSSGTLAGAVNLVYNSTSEQVSVAGNATGINFVVNGTANFFAEQIVGNSTTGESAGLLIQAGTNGSDTAFKILNEAGTSTFLQVIGNGGMELGAPTGGDEGLGTLNATGLYVNGVTAATAQSGSFTGTLTGMTATVTGTFNYVISGDTVTLYSSGGITGTSNSTAMTITGLPNAINPVNAQLFVTWGVENSGTGNNLAIAEINTNNTVTLGLSSSGASSTPVTFGVNDFTSSGTKGINGGWTITYSLD